MKVNSVEIIPVALKAPQLLIQAVFDGRRLGMQLFNIGGMAKVLSKNSAWWIPSRRMWAIEASNAHTAENWLRHAYQGHHVDLDGILDCLSTAIKNPDLDFFTQLLDVQIFPLEQGDLTMGAHAVSFSYDLPCVNAMRYLTGTFHKPAAAWQVRGGSQQVFEALARFAGIRPDYIFEHEIPVVLEELTFSQSEASPIQVPSAKMDASGFDNTGTDSKKEISSFLSAHLGDLTTVPVDMAAFARIEKQAGLRDYQVAGVLHLASKTGACLGDDMGLGKTRQSIVAAWLAAAGGRILILCPASLRINWEREIHAVFSNAVVGMVGEDRLGTLAGCEWVIANYERVGGLVRATDLAFSVMLVDEAHYLKTHQSGRTRNAFVMATRIPKRYVITGTPLLNREIELHTLLRLTGHSTGNLSMKEFRKAFSGSSSNRAELAAVLKGWMLRRRKDVLTDLGNKRHSVRYLSPEQGLTAYKEIYDDMAMQAMPKITKLRQCLETLKTQFLIETVEGLQAEDKIIIFCEYMSTVAAMTEAFSAAGIKAVQLVGSDTARKRQKAIDAFQCDIETRVFIGTTLAAGVGITLTAANYVAFASMPWTPALMRQAEDRAYRLGQQRDVMVIVPIILNTIDQAVWKILEGKRSTEMDVVEAVTTRPEGASSETLNPAALVDWMKVTAQAHLSGTGHADDEALICA